MAANTEILIKRSLANSSPSSLMQGELAYSYASNTLFIGTADGLATLNVGGQFYTSQIENATDANTGNTLVRRDPNGNASFNWVTANYFAGTFHGNSDSATKLETARDFSIDGLDVEASAVSFDGTNDVILQGNLKTTGVTAGTYGGQTQIPVITVDTKGRLSSAANVQISTSLAINADSGGPSAVNLIDQTLDIAGGSGITSSVADQTITLDVDDTVVRSNTAMQMQLIDGDIQISGNLTVLGNTTQIEVQTLNIADPLIYLASNNYSSDLVDIGFVGNYFDGANNRHAGVFRHAGDKEFYVFDNYDQEPTANTIDPTDASFRLATLNANIKSQLVQAHAFLANEGAPDGTANAGYSFQNDGGWDTGLFSEGDGRVELWSNAVKVLEIVRDEGLTLQNGTVISDSGAPGLFVDSLNYAETSNVVFYNPDSKEVTYGSMADLRPDRIANGAYSMWISDIDGLVTAPGKIIAAQSEGTFNGGFSFSGNEGGADTGMFSPSDGILSLYSNDQEYFRLDQNTGYNYTYVPLQLQNGSVLTDNNNYSLVLGKNAEISNYPQSIAIGYNVNNDGGQQWQAIAIGAYAGWSNQNGSAVAIGARAGYNNQQSNAVAIGRQAGNNSQGSYSIAMGWYAGNQVQNQAAVAIGEEAGRYNQNSETVAIGSWAGREYQGWKSVAIGSSAGNYYQGDWSVAIGLNAGRTSQGHSSVAMGHVAGYDHQGVDAVAIGVGAGKSYQGNYAIAIGERAGYGADGVQGNYAIAIGARAGYYQQYEHSIILNASGDNLDSSRSGLFINPIAYEETQDAVDDGLMFYNQTTKEVRYSYILDGGSF